MNVTIVVCIGNVAGHSQLPCNIDEQEIVKWQGDSEVAGRTGGGSCRDETERFKNSSRKRSTGRQMDVSEKDNK